MNMKREELRQWFSEWLDDYYDELHSEDELTPEVAESVLAALRPISRERVEKMRSRWVPLNNTQEHFCESCGVAFNLYAYCKNDYQFCPACGAPMTDEAVDMVMERINEMEEMKK